MGSAFEFVIIADEADGERLMNESVGEVMRIEQLLTEFSTTSQTSLLNQHAGIKPVQVDEEVYAILKRCQELSRLTQGAFDITAGVLKKLYNFKGVSFVLPGGEQINQALRKTGADKIQLRADNKVYLTVPGMHIGFAAVGKGYAADMVKKLLIKQGVMAGVISASGDLTAWGHRLDGSPWKIGIADPAQRDSVLLWIPVENASVATSGDYEQYFEANGIRYSHTIDPKSGRPVTGIKSVTIVSPSAELSDALATAVFVMGIDVGLHFVEQLPDIHALIVRADNEVFMSGHLKLNTTEHAGV